MTDSWTHYVFKNTKQSRITKEIFQLQLTFKPHILLWDISSYHMSYIIVLPTMGNLWNYLSLQKNTIFSHGNILHSLIGKNETESRCLHYFIKPQFYGAYRTCTFISNYIQPFFSMLWHHIYAQREIFFIKFKSPF